MGLAVTVTELPADPPRVKNGFIHETRELL
jgi:hypothetical protein